MSNKMHYTKILFAKSNDKIKQKKIVDYKKIFHEMEK